MAKVSKIGFVIDGKHVECDVYYSQTKKFTLKGFPQTVFAATGHNQYNAGIQNKETEDELKKMYQGFVDEYHAKKKTARKVILFEVEASNFLLDDADGNLRKEFLGLFDNVHSRGGEREMRLEINYGVYWEVQDNGIEFHQVRDADEDDASGIGWKANVNSDDMELIDWTPEREKFFDDLTDAMRKLVLKVATVLKDGRKVEEIADAGLKLLSQEPSIVQWARSKDE